MTRMDPFTTMANITCEFHAPAQHKQSLPWILGEAFTVRRAWHDLIA